VISCLTAQTDQQLQRLTPIEPADLLAQLNAAFEVCHMQQLQPVIKIGLLPTVRLRLALAECLQQAREHWPTLTVVLDPVLAASHGQSLQHAQPHPPNTALAHQLDWQWLLQQVTVLTPNAIELARLVGNADDTEPSANPSEFSAQLHAGFKEAGLPAIWLKGGHRQTTAVEGELWCIESQGDYRCQLQLQSPRQVGQWRGTGCRFASALAIGLGAKMALTDAICFAESYLQSLIAGSGKGPRLSDTSAFCHGPTSPTVQWPEPSVKQPTKPLAFAPLGEAIGIYPVVDDLALAQALIDAGCRTLQLRLKQLPTPSQQLHIKQLIASARQAQCQFFLNDHWQLAIELQAYGVHLGQEDLRAADLQAIANTGLRLGISTHGWLELLQALAVRPSYIAIGHILPTPTKQMSSRPQGVANLSRQVAYCQAVDIATVAIGGLDSTHLTSIRQAQVSGMAVVRAITQQAAPVQAFLQLQQAWEALC